MAIEVKVPEVGESISEVEIGSWLKTVGDNVARDEDLVTIETDKATVEVLAPQSGTLSRIVKNSGETAHVGEVIAYLELGTGAGTDENSRVAAAVSPPAAAQPKSERIVEEAPPAREETAEDGDAAEPPPDDLPEPKPENAPQQPDPRIERRAGSSGDAASTRVERDHRPRPVMSTATAAGEHPRANRSTAPRRSAPAPRRLPPETERRETAVPMTPLRRRLAERLVQAQQTAALLTTFNEIDMSAVGELRRAHQEDFMSAHGVKLGLMSFFVKAAVEALKALPEVNAEIRDDHIIYRDYIDVGVAVGGGRGLVVPVLRNAGQMSFAAIEKAIGDFARRAAENKLKPDELQGGTFTISNGGVYGSLLSTPIVNPPQSAILGMHAIQERPVAHAGAVVIRPMMYVALTYDHRIIDGREAVTFLRRIKTSVEDPTRMLLEV